MEHQNRTCDRAQTEALAEKLCHLVERQLAFARAGNLSQVEALGERTNEIVTEMTQAARDVPSVAEPQRARLKKLYRELELVLGAGREDVRDRLEQLRQVKRAVGTYRGATASK